MAGYTDEVIGTVDEKTKVSYNDTTSDFLENKIIGDTGVINTTVIDDGENEKLQIGIEDAAITKAKLNADIAGTGISGGAGNAVSLDINSITAETALDNADTIAIYDNSAGLVRKQTRANFLKNITDLYVDVKDPTGFENQTDSTISFVNATRTFTIQPAVTSFVYYINGVKYTKSGAENIVITDTEGLWYIYYNGATLTASQSFPGWYGYPLVSVLNWDATNKVVIILAEERHGMNMPSATHEYLHNNIRTRYEPGSGLNLTANVSGDGSDNTHAQVSITDGIIWDEDIKVNILDGTSGRFVQDISPVAKIPVYWRSGANGYWRKDVATDYPMKQGSSRLQYNLYSGGVWSTTDITINDNYVNMWIVATTSITEPIVAVLGQGNYGTLAAAQAVSPANLSLGTLFTNEAKLIWKIIIQTATTYSNTPHARIRQLDDYRESGIGPITGVIGIAHNTLVSRDVINSHPASAIQPVTTSFNNILSSADDTVQKALDTLDNQFPVYQLFADRLDNPITSDWKVNALAPAAAGTTNTAFTVRKFDDTAEEGVGFTIETSSTAINLIINFRGRAETAPGVARQVILKLYNRDVPDNAVIPAWSAGVTLTAIDIPTNAYYQYDTQTIALSTLGITAGRVVQFELTRNGADGGDTLVGDWNLLEIKVTFS